ncbi:sigma-70 family RNA polymerase sigma factor [Ramlibacter sp.]|uniref:sigma-70 family RNA polymerase sigma factor n=1 Tax=Ramlibacter sp. TaxID=1917967 RepID=UPI002D262C24|nr:sigma-70 family RNA polymerase sigma factor [Ramlibacter sp.]HYD75613.1 sigma-70 family RNA polymerase sigma factor [Ramlibacter sp.]
MQSGELEAQIPQLRRYARSLTGDAWAADDLVQDTLERACDRWQLWKAGSDLRAWLFTVMHNLFVDSARRALRQAGQRVDLEDAAPELVAPAGATEQVLDLQRCLQRLPEEQREVLLLVTLQDLSYEEVARVTGTPVGTVMSRLSRARSRLRELMEGAPAASAAAPAVLPFKRMK